MKTKTMLTALAFLALALVVGCISARNSAVPMVPDVGVDVVTRHRYRVTRVYDGETAKASGIRTSFLPRFQPRVFSSDGIPVVLRIASPRVESSSSWMTLFSMCTIGGFPMLMQMSYSFGCSVDLPDEKDGSAPFELLSRQDSANTWLPTAYLFYNGAPDFDGHRVFCEHTTICGDKNYFHIPYEFDGQTAEMTGLDNMLQKALAYGVAAKLKELEDSGKVDVMLRKQAEQRSAAPAHRVVKLDREPGSDFVHSFAIEILRMPTDERSAIKAVLREFIASLKEDYLDTFPSARKEALVVSISGLKREGLRISGRAAVLTIKPLSLSYDQNTRCGKLSVRFNAGQEDEARKWIRKNIETLARDKNIALVTGEIPPAAKFYLGREELKDGNVLEIEFKTE